MPKPLLKPSPVSTFIGTYAYRKISWTRRVAFKIEETSLPRALRKLADILEKTPPEIVGPQTQDGIISLSMVMGVDKK